MKNIAIFASGTGSNFSAICKAFKEDNTILNISLLVSDKEQSLVVKKANKLKIEVFTFNPKEYKNRDEYEQVILSKLVEYKIDFIVLAGYMRIIGHTILNNYQRKIINIHPSLLPSFKGMDAIGQAIDCKVKITGVTVPYVDKGMDTGEIISQQALDISNLHTRSEIEKEIHNIEHILYPKTIKKLLEELYEKSFD